MEDDIRENIQTMIRTMEIFYEELEKSNLPDDVKKALLLNAKFDNQTT